MKMIYIHNMEHEYLEQILNMFFIKDSGKICYYEWYFFFRCWKKQLTLHELLDEVENVDSESNIPEHIDITIFPPDNDDDDNNDEDNCEERNVNINNLH